jgi:hypothetical protein
MKSNYKDRVKEFVKDLKLSIQYSNEDIRNAEQKIKLLRKSIVNYRKQKALAQQELKTVTKR